MTVANHRDDLRALSLPRRLAANLETAYRLLRMPARRPAPFAPQWSRTTLAAAGIGVVALILFVMAVFDSPTIRAVHDLPHWIVWPFDQITDFGKSGWFLFPFGILFLVLAAAPPDLPAPVQRVLTAIAVRVGFLFAAVAVPGLVNTVIKHVIGRARPFVTGVADPFAFHPFVWKASYASMPSGHVTTVFSVLVAIGSLWPQTRSVLWIYALLIAASRVMVLAHHPSDLVFGAVLGAGGALVVRHYFAVRRLGFVIAPDGGIERLPAPSLRRIKAVARALLS
ncbi:MAG TPA: phosphatase PAP2 family protein [Pseudolabrys sp.]|jgi:undecaprenyl-diphosphatase|nr:phosphatase PAP2 family protein [Pseudolabrys sp.]